MKNLLTVVTAALLISGCGGGGNGGGGEPRNIPPQAVIVTSADSGMSPVQIAFDAASSTDTDGNITRYSWEFGDGNTANGVSVEHTYDAGSESDQAYTVTLTVTDNGGITDSVTTSITALKNAFPVAAFTYSQADPASRTIEFDASESSDVESTELLFSWDFGDGNTADGINPSYEYPANGQYTITLTVDDQTGRTAALQQTAVVTNGQFSIVGQLNLASGTVSDTDTNDPQSQFQPNNTLAQAQVVPSQADISGFVTYSGTGVVGDRFENAADGYDIFLAALESGQRLRLHMQDHVAGADLDLYLLNEEGALVDYSTGYEEYEELEVANTGNYYLLVDAFSGTSAYNLRLFDSAQQTTSLVRASMTASDEFVVGEAVGRVAPRVDKSRLATLQSVGALPSNVRADRPLKIRTAKAVSSLEDTLQSRSGAGRLLKGLKKMQISPQQRARLDTIYGLKTLRASGQFEYIELNRLRRHASAGDPLLGRLWHYEQIGVPAAWSRATGNGIIVAVLDTGILPDHEDLVGQTVPGYDLISEPAMAVDGDGIDPDPTDPGDDPVSANDSWHGSHVAGTIAAVANNGLGIAGAAYGAKIMPVRVLGYGGGTDYDIVQGIYFAAGLDNDSGTVPERRADIINMSLGGYGYSQLGQDAIQAARAAGVIVVAAAGNETDIADNYSPAGLAGVVTVAAIGRDAHPTNYTNYGPSVELLAPGGDLVGVSNDGGVLSTLGRDNIDGGVDYIYGGYQGTSMAAPHVSAVIALMKQLAPDMTPEQFDTVIANFGVSTGNGTRDTNFGYGLIDAELAVNSAAALAGSAPVGSVFVESGRLLGMGARLEAEIVVGVSAADVSVVEVQKLDPWLSTSYLDAANNGAGRYQVSVDANQLEVGTHMGALRFLASTGSTYDLWASVQVVPQDFESGQYVGSAYLVFADWETGETAGSVQAYFDTEQSSYLYHSPELDAGRQYQVIAGTDVDRDFFICDVDELCGVYGDGAGPVPVAAGEFDTDSVGIGVNLQVLTPVESAPAKVVADEGVSRRLSPSK